MSFTLAPICAKTDVEAYLGISSTVSSSDDALIEMLRGFVENDMRGFVRHNITQPSENYVQYFPDREILMGEDTLIGMEIYGTRAVPILLVEGADRLQLANAFVRSVANVWVNYYAFAGQAPNAFPPQTLLQLGIDYWLDLDYNGMDRSGILYRFGMSWPWFPRSVKVEYMAGFTQAELADGGRWSYVRFAAIEETAHQFKLAKERMGNRSDGVGRVSRNSYGKEANIEYDPKSLVRAPLSEECRMRLEPIMSLYQ